MSQYLISVWHASGVYAAARALAAQGSSACGRPVELRKLQG